MSILGLLLGTRHLALAGVSQDALRPARRLLIFASVVTLALNVAEPLVAGEFGKAAFNAVGPLLLIGWAEVGPDLLRVLTTAKRPADAAHEHGEPDQTSSAEPTAIGQTASESTGRDAKRDDTSAEKKSDLPASRVLDDDLLEQAREEDTRHWDAHRRPISADASDGGSASARPAPGSSSRSSGQTRNDNQLKTA